MSTIRATCNDCGDVELASADLTVIVHENVPTQGHYPEGHYCFDCPSCGEIVKKAARPQIVEILVTSGVRLITIKDSPELDERRELLTDGRKPIDHNDILEFHESIDEELRRLLGLDNENLSDQLYVEQAEEWSDHDPHRDVPPDIKNV